MEDRPVNRIALLYRSVKRKLRSVHALVTARSYCLMGPFSLAMMVQMSPIETLGLALGAGFSSGLNLYATVATLGLLQRFGVIHLPPSLAVVSHPIVLGMAIGLYVIEFFADKIPYLDTIWDAIHTFIRPPAAAL